MDIELMEALRNYRKEPFNDNAARLVAAMDRAGVMPDSPREDTDGGGPITCDLDDKGNATGWIEIGDRRMLLFHKHVVAVQVIGQPAVVNPDPLCSSVTTKKRLREWPFARHTVWRPDGADLTNLPAGGSFEQLIRFKPL